MLGVCAAIANMTGINVNVIRIIFVVGVFLGFGIVTYLLLWLIFKLTGKLPKPEMANPNSKAISFYYFHSAIKSLFKNM